MMSSLSGKHALVTGGGTGSGAQIALLMARNGAQVTIAGRRLEPLIKTAAGQERIYPEQCNVTDEKSVQELFQTSEKARGSFDIVIANAGMARSAPLHKTDFELWQSTLSVNLTGSFLVARAGLQAMLKIGWGRIIFVASTAGLKGYPYVTAYCAAKHGIVGLTRSLALETAKKGITVNAICPGFMETPMLNESIKTITDKTGLSESEARASLVSGNPQGRFIQPDEVASMIMYLCSEHASSINGQALSLSGGEV